jgi:hypothetical protein
VDANHLPAIRPIFRRQVTAVTTRMTCKQGIQLSAEIKLNKFHFAKQKRVLTGSITALIVLEMNRRLKYILLAFALLNFTVAGITDAAAYLDPGTGSIIFQGVIAVVATGLAVFATAWKNVTGVLGGVFRSNNKKHPDKND